MLCCLMQVTSQILYAKNLYDETKQTLPPDNDSQLDFWDKKQLPAEFGMGNMK